MKRVGVHVLILGARAPVALEWARAFAAAGWQVTMADSLAWPLARSSRAAQRYLRLPPPRQQPHAWAQAMIAAVERHRIDVVLPTSEEVFYLAAIADQLNATVFSSDLALLRKLHHKGLFAQLSADWPIPSPQTLLLTAPEQLEQLRPHAEDWVFKPAYSRFATRTLIRPRRSELDQLQPSPERPWVAQRHLVGAEVCSFSLMVDGRLTAHTCYRPRHRAGRGSAVWFEPIDPAPVRELVTHFGEITGFTGQVGFDLIASPDGYRVIECNPRATSGVHLLSSRPQQLVAAVTGQIEGVVLSDGRARMLAVPMLLFGLAGADSLAGFVRDLGRADDVIHRRGDPGPLFGQWLGLAEVAARAVRTRTGMLAASTADIEWDGQSWVSDQ